LKVSADLQLLAERDCAVDVTSYAVREGGKVTVGVDVDLVAPWDDASIRHVMAGGRWRVSHAGVMMHSTIRARIQEPNA